MNVSQSVKKPLSNLYSLVKTRKEIGYVILFSLALIGFEAFNYSTTDFALSDLLGDLRFLDFSWASLLAIAFCGIDFAGIARLLAPQSDHHDHRSTWFMFGAWILAATMNAILTWWGVVLAIGSHPVVSAGMVNERFVLRTVPVFIALMVWVIRIMIVGSLSKKADRLTEPAVKPGAQTLSRRELRQAQSRAAHPAPSNCSVSAGLNNPAFTQLQNAKRGHRPAPTYVPLQDETNFHTLKSPGARQRRV